MSKVLWITCSAACTALTCASLLFGHFGPEIEEFNSLDWIHGHLWTTEEEQLGCDLKVNTLPLNLKATEEETRENSKAQKVNGLSSRKKRGSKRIHHKHRTHSKAPKRFKRPSHISHTIWRAMKPHFLPIDHPIRSKLDSLFKTRVTASSETLTEAGFFGRENNRAGRFSHATVAQHEKVAGYVLKFFTDDSPFEDWPQLKTRVEGAKSLRAAIDRHGWNKWFKAPQKWIYPLPVNPPPVAYEGCPLKGFIVVAEDMDIIRKRVNYRCWREQMSEPRLEALSILLQEEGLLDSVYPFNIPFSRDGRIAFIDLEHNHLWPVPFFKLQPYLHPTLQGHWELITRNPSM